MNYPVSASDAFTAVLRAVTAAATHSGILSGVEMARILRAEASSVTHQQKSKAPKSKAPKSKAPKSKAPKPKAPKPN